MKKQKERASDMRIESCVRVECNAEKFAGAAYQDAKYGEGKRAKNPLLAAGGHISYRCTVCGYAPGAKGGPATLKRDARVKGLLGMSFAVAIAKCAMGGK